MIVERARDDINTTVADGSFMFSTQAQPLLPRIPVTYFSDTEIRGGFVDSDVTFTFTFSGSGFQTAKAAPTMLDFTGMLQSITSTENSAADFSVRDINAPINEVIGKTWNYILSSDDIIYGSTLNSANEGDSLYGYNGNDKIYGRGDRDFLYGGNGNDILDGGSGNDNLDGGAGFDIAAYSGSRREYTLEKITSGYKITDTIVNRDGSDPFVLNIEKISFVDGSLVFDVTSANAAAAYRLYGGAFARTPDEGGFRFWASKLDEKASLRSVATEFINSGEFIGRYGSSLSNAAFVDALYQNVLSRGGDAGGVAYWNDVLNKQLTDRASVLVEFTQLPEFVGMSAANISNGYWVV